jgi:hypothetical protein
MRAARPHELIRTLESGRRGEVLVERANTLYSLTAHFIVEESLIRRRSAPQHGKEGMVRRARSPRVSSV